MIKRPTRILSLFLLLAFLFIGVNSANAQKKAGKPAPAKQVAKPAEKAPAEKSGAVNGNNAKGDGQADALPGSYIILAGTEEVGSEKARKALELLKSDMPSIKMTEMQMPNVYIMTGDPEKLSRLRMAFPELVWLTADQFAYLERISKKLPDLGSNEYLQKLSNQ